MSDPGRYKVYARWTAHANRASNAPYTIHHDGGATLLRVNQELAGGQWNLLGSFDFTPGQDHKVELTDDANEYVIADAVRFMRDGAASAEVIVDNPEAAAAGSWTSATLVGGTGSWGDDYSLHPAGGAGANSLTWTPALAKVGRHRVYARWVAGSDRAPDARYTVHHAGGAATVSVDQQVNGGQWVLLGSYDLAPGANHRVVLSDEGGGTYVSGDAVAFVEETLRRAVVADAVKFERPETPAFPVTASTLTREFVTLEGRPLALIEGGEVAWVHADHLGTPQAMTDAAGALTWERVARPFGETHAESGGTANPQRFPGQRHDPETGLAYNYFRDYDPSLGRYVESDPIGLLGGLNTYGYVLANPLKYSDPLGLDVSLCCKPIYPGSSYNHCYVANTGSGNKSTTGLFGSGSAGYIIQDHGFDMASSGEVCGPPDPDINNQTSQCIQNTVDNYPNPSDYDLNGPNSNTFAGICANDCGLTPPPIVSPGGVSNSATPGWGQDKPGPYDFQPGPRK